MASTTPFQRQYSGAVPFNTHPLTVPVFNFVGEGVVHVFLTRHRVRVNGELHTLADLPLPIYSGGCGPNCARSEEGIRS